MSLPRYPEYKDSGVEWLGQVPEHWVVLSIKRLSPVQRGASPRPIDDPKYFDDEGEYAWVRIADVSASSGVLAESTQRLSALGSSLSVKLNPGELFVSIAGTVGKPCITAIKACIHDGFVYFPLLSVAPKFLYRIFEAGQCYAGLGKWGTQLNLNTDSIGSIQVALPPSEETSAILRFLDRETSKIDALIAEQEKLLTLLAEKRQATISHAVTKGLNPDAPMKDSGVAWLGEVPAHWAVSRLKYATSLIVDCPHETPVYSDNGDYMVIRTADVTEGKLDPRQMYTVSETEYLNRIRRKTLFKDDIVYGREGERWGFAALVPEDDKYCLGQRMMQFRSTSTTCPAYLMWQLNSVTTYRQGQQDTVGATSPHVNVGTIRNYTLAEPPIEEQQKIATFLDTETARLDALTAEATRGIALLKERRSALISAAVTGKIDVRHAVAEMENCHA